MKQKKKLTFNDFFELSLYLICTVTFVYYLVIGNGGKVFQSGLIIVVLLLLRGLITWTKSDLPFALRFSILFFIALAMLVANLFNMYGVIPHLDKIEHLLSGVILCFVGLFILGKKVRHHKSQIAPSIAIWFAFFFSVAMAGVWEIYEFTVDGLLGFKSQNGSLYDTMLDIICGTVGAIATAFYLVYKVKKNPNSLFDSK
ncbi:hypothetical protein [Paenibacillus arenosi]|uniref:Membrane-spanning protein n=1 Tax=Paenibacillus arenosi TaxID=2774142 RepID=A0ABR9AZI9_9BACL|nr:hypothetical protein [Paenibacillus arenosi]MBD8499316.1 hypothetical protein [Paenibacillus arenosi]